MAERAQVRSLEAIDDFRAHLVVYLSKVRPLLDEIGGDLRRTQAWIENDGRQQAERDRQRRTRALEEAQQALLSARLSSFREATVMEQQAVHNARRAVAQVEERLQRIRTWSREFGPRTAPLARQVGVLETVLSQDLASAVAWLTAILQHLDAYTETRPVGDAPGTSPASGPEPGVPDLPVAGGNTESEPPARPGQESA